MNTKQLFLVSLLSILVCACNRNEVLPEQEQTIINTVYQSLESTPEQFATKMSEQNLRHAGHFELPDYTYDSYTNLKEGAGNYADQLLVGISHANEEIIRIEYSRYLNNEKNPAACYKLLSDQIASFGYSEWAGYYEDDASDTWVIDAIRENLVDSAQVAGNRNDLCNHIDNSLLRDSKKLQYYMETFVYTPKNGNRWKGQVVMYTYSYSSGMDEYSARNVKDILFSFSLEKIQ